MVRPALQLYSVRAAEIPRPELFARISDAGYEGVEFASPPTADADALAAELADAGLETAGIHVRPADLSGRLPAVVDSCRELGCDAVVLAHVSPSHFRTRRRVRRLAQYVEATAARLADAGVSLHYHNQCFEFQRVATPAVVDVASGVFNPTPLPAAGQSADAGPVGTCQRMAGTASERLLDAVGSPPAAETFADTGLAYFLRQTDPALVRVEPDVGNVRAAGFEPRTVVDATADRLTHVHVKDEFVEAAGPDPLETPAPIGDGDVDVRAGIEMAAAAEAEWVVLENDDPLNPLAPIRNGADAFESATV